MEGTKNSKLGCIAHQCTPVVQVFEVVSELVVAGGSDTGESQAEENRQHLAKQLEALLHKVLAAMTIEHFASSTVCSKDTQYTCFVPFACCDSK